MIKNVIFSGGGFKGWAFIGTIRALNEYVKYSDLESITGTSIGSLFGFCYLLQIEWEYLLDFIMNLNFKDQLDINLKNIVSNQSLLTGDKYKKRIIELVGNKIDTNITFIDLYKYHSKIKFTVNALNITDSKLDFFNYSLTPNVKVIDAIMASSSLPLILPAYYIHGKYYFDGGLCNNCVTNIIDNLESVAFDLHDPNSQFGKSKSKIIDLIMVLFNILNVNNKNNNDITFSVLDSSFDKEMLNLNQTRDDIFNIYITGYINSKDIIYNNFIAIQSS